MKILSIQKNSSVQVFFIFINKTETRQKRRFALLFFRFFLFNSEELCIVFLKVNSPFPLPNENLLTPQRGVLICLLQWNCSSIKEMWCLWCLKKPQCLSILLLPSYSSNLRYKLKDGLLTGFVLPQIIPIQRWACKSVPQIRAFKLCMCNLETVVRLHRLLWVTYKK